MWIHTSKGGSRKVLIINIHNLPETWENGTSGTYRGSEWHALIDVIFVSDGVQVQRLTWNSMEALDWTQPSH